MIFHSQDLIFRNTSWFATLNLICHYITIGFFCTSIKINLFLAFLLSFINCLTIVSQGEYRETIKEYFVLLFAYLYIFVFMQSYTVIINKLSFIFEQTKKKAESEIQNKSMFVASISHDLKNPLNALLGCLDMLKSSPNVSNADKKCLLTASYSGQILIYLIANILDSAKIETGKFDLEWLPMGIVEEVKKIMKIEVELSKKKGIMLYKKFINNFPKLVYGDAMRFTQVLLNLLGNSIKFTSHGYVAVVLKWAKNAEEAKKEYYEESQRNSKDEVNIIPSEDFFINNSKGSRHGNSKRCKVKQKFSMKILRNKQVGDDVIDDNINEGVEPIGDIIAKYNLSNGTPRSLCPPVPKMAAKTTDSPMPRICLSRTKPTNFSSYKNLLIAANKATGSTSKFKEDSKVDSYCSSKGSEENKCIKKGILIHNDEADEEADFGNSGILVIDIIDTGIGMKEEELQRLFKPFSQANSSVKSKFGGTGLGLWISKQLVHLMSGCIQVRSQYQRGTRFRVTIPLNVASLKSSSSARSLFSPKSVNAKEVDTFVPSPFDLHKTNCASDLLRNNEKKKFSGKALKGKYIMLIEDEMSQDDAQLEQVFHQLSTTGITLIYSSNSSCLQKLAAYQYRFEAILAISSHPTTSTMKIITQIMKILKDKEITQIPIAVATGKQHYKNKNRCFISKRVQ